MNATEFGRGFAEGLVSSLLNISSTIDAHTIGQKVESIVLNFFQGLNPSHLASQTGDGLENILKNFNLTKISSTSGREINQAVHGFLDHLNIQTHSNHFSSDISEVAKDFTDIPLQVLEHIRSETQEIFANIFKDNALKVAPWAAFSTVILIGAPLATHYLYKKASHNIGKPKIVKTVYKVGLWNRTQKAVSNICQSIFKATKNSIKTSLLTGGYSFIAALAHTLALRAFGLGEGFGEVVLKQTFCSGSSCSSYGLDLIQPTILLGGCTFGTSLLKDSYLGYQKLRQKTIAPIFSDAIQRRIDEITNAVKNLKKHGGYMQNLLLFGPGGTGKTMISQYIAKQSKMNYFMVSGGDFAQYIKRGEHVTELNKLFEEAKKEPSILFIDECESLCRKRSEMDRSELFELINAFLNHTGEASKNLMVILTTNREEDLDPAVLSRMDHKLQITPPDLQERKKILELYIHQVFPKQPLLNNSQKIQAIAKNTDGLTGRALFKLVNHLKTKQMASNQKILTKEMIDQTIEDFISQEDRFS